MLLFLNLDCVLEPPADALGPQFHGHVGLRRLESVLQAWPQLQLVITSDRRYRMTLAHFRDFFGEAFRHRLIATTALYSCDRKAAGRLREDEVLDFLVCLPGGARAWLALDRHPHDYRTQAERLVTCQTLTREVVTALHASLRCQAHTPQEDLAALAVEHSGGSMAGASPRTASRPPSFAIPRTPLAANGLCPTSL